MKHPIIALCLLTLGTALSTTSAHAANKSTWFSKGDHTGKWTIKARVNKSFGSVDHSVTSNGIPITLQRTGEDEEENNFIGVNFALEYGINDYFSVEGSAGYATSPSIGITLSTNPVFGPATTATDSGSISRYPISATVLYHPAPYGAFSPYIGAGYHYTFTSSSFTSIETEDMSGGLFRLGFDYWNTKKIGLNFDIEHKLMSGVTDYSKMLGINLEDDITHNPTTVSLGVNYRF